jgi:CheY-like chemotaxis protein
MHDNEGRQNERQRRFRRNTQHNEDAPIAMLEDLGRTVFEVLSAQEAPVILGQENAVQLVLTDLAMPRMSGLEPIAEIKTAWPTLPVSWQPVLLSFRRELTHRRSRSRSHFCNATLNRPSRRQFQV